jgi:selenocysteine lyase/cysteine desulfurase
MSAELHSALLENLGPGNQGVELHCPGPGQDRIPVVSFNLKGWPPGDAGGAGRGLWHRGAHRPALRALVAPRIWAPAGGSVRVSLGPYNTAGEVEALLGALAGMKR